MERIWREVIGRDSDEAGMWRFQGETGKSPTTVFEVSQALETPTAFCSPRIGQKFELRCEIEVDSPEKDQVSVGVLLGEHGTGHYVVCGFKQNQGVATLQAAATDRWDETTGRAKWRAGAKTNVLIEVEDGRATCHPQRHSVADKYQTASLFSTRNTADRLRGARSQTGHDNPHPQCGSADGFLTFNQPRAIGKIFVRIILSSLAHGQPVRGALLDHGGNRRFRQISHLR